MANRITFELSNVEYSIVSCSNIDYTIILHNKTKYININKLCSDNGKKYSEWTALKDSKEIISYLKKFNKMPFYDNKNNENVDFNGSFVHSTIATSVARWISIELFVIVNEIVNKSYYNDSSLKPKRVVKKVSDKKDDDDEKPKRSVKKDEEDKPKKVVKKDDDDKPKKTVKKDEEEKPKKTVKKNDVDMSDAKSLLKAVNALDKKLKNYKYKLGSSALQKLADFGYDDYVSCSEYESVEIKDKTDVKELTKILKNLDKKFKNCKYNLKTCVSKLGDLGYEDYETYSESD